MRVYIYAPRQDTVDEMNKNYQGVLHLARTGTDSHMWNGKVTLMFFEVLSKASFVKCSSKMLVYVCNISCAFVDCDFSILCNAATQALRAKRAALGVDARAKALVICDRCGSHNSEVFFNLRAQWASELNVMILGHDKRADVCMPGGFGACAGPNDGWHQFFHSLRTKHIHIYIYIDSEPNKIIYICTYIHR